MRLFAVLPAVAVLLASACRGEHDPAETTSPSPSPIEAPATESPSPSPSPTPVTGALAIVNAKLIDGTGAPPVAPAHIIIGDGHITRIDFSANPPPLPPGYDVIDAGLRTVMPGLIDGHVHVTRSITNVNPVTLGARVDERALVPFLQGGVTTMRDVGTATVMMKTIKNLVDRISMQGEAPRVIWAGPLVTVENGYPFSVPRYAAGGEAVATPEEGAALVDQLADDGAGLIKLALERGYYGDFGWAVLPLDVVRAITAKAHERGLLVTAHVTSIDEVRLALDGGVDNLAHTPLEPIPDEMMREMIARGIGMVTTATVWGQRQEEAARNAKRFADAGGILSIGTDFGCCDQVAGIEPYLAELRFLNGAGMTPMQLITAATRNGALVAGLGDATGTIEPGKRADLIILDGDPLEDFTALASVRTVMLNGRVVFGR